MGSKKNRKGIVFSTDPEFEYNYFGDEEQQTLPPTEQMLVISTDRKQRKGKTVTIVAGFVGTSADLQSLEKMLKTSCGSGGSSKEGSIIIQGDNKDRIVSILENEGYRVKTKG